MARLQSVARGSPLATTRPASSTQETDARPMGRQTRGVRGIKLKKNEKVMSMLVLTEGDVLTATERGFGKRTHLEEFSVQGRGGMGVIGIKTSPRNGSLVGAQLVQDDDDIMLISDNGTLVRTGVSDISTLERNTQGVTLIRVSDDEKLVGLAKIESILGDDEDGDIDSASEAEQHQLE